MPSPFFSKFPKMLYDIDGTGTNVRAVVDIFHKDEFRSIVLNNTLILLPYSVKEGETPEIIADKIYGSSIYYWIILFANNVFNRWTDWPLDYYQFLAFLESKYGSVPAAQRLILHYVDTIGNIVDPTTFGPTWDQTDTDWDDNQTIWDSSEVTPVYAYDYETAINDGKREIRILDPKYRQRVETELDNLLAAS